MRTTFYPTLCDRTSTMRGKPGNLSTTTLAYPEDRPFFHFVSGIPFFPPLCRSSLSSSPTVFSSGALLASPDGRAPPLLRGCLAQVIESVLFFFFSSATTYSRLLSPPADSWFAPFFFLACCPHVVAVYASRVQGQVPTISSMWKSVALTANGGGSVFFIIPSMSHLALSFLPLI